MKKIKYLLAVIICNLFMMNVYAANSSITAKASSSKVQVGDTVTVTVTVSTVSSVPLGAWEFSVGYDNSVLTYVSSTLENGLTSAGYVSSNNIHSKTYTLKFKAKAAGTSAVTIKNPLVVNFNTDEQVTTNVSGASITVVNPAPKPSNSNQTSNNQSNSNENKKSANNYLSSIILNGGYIVSPKFDKNTTNYSVSVPNDVRNIKISAKTEDTNATVSGIGNKNLVEGKNKFNLIVTAENGNRRTYTINVVVKELNPIKVNIEGKEYTLIQKKEELEAPSNYIPTTVNINATEVPALTNEITKFTLVGLTDQSGDTNLYKYNDDKYTLYKEYKFSGIRLYIEEPSNDIKIKKAKEIKITLDGETINAYQLDKNTYPLIYGMNVETGEYNWYTYDSSERTIQKYVTGNKNSVEDVVVNVPNEIVNDVSNPKFEQLTYILCGILSMLVSFLIAAAVRIAKTNQEKSI